MEDCFDDGGSKLRIQRRATHKHAEGDRSEEEVERQVAVERNREVSAGNATVKEGERLQANGRLEGPEHFSKRTIALRLGSESGYQLRE
jgi:hypothetical protein